MKIIGIRILYFILINFLYFRYLSLKASLLAPEMLKLLAKFHATTAFWLVQVYLNNEIGGEGKQCDYIPKEYKIVTFPLPETVPDTLRYSHRDLIFSYCVGYLDSNKILHIFRCIPEFVVENTIRFLCFLRRLNPNVFEEQGLFFLTPVLTEAS